MLDVVLFERIGNQIRLTKNGETLLPYAEQILSLCEEAIASVTSAKGKKITGELRIAMNETLCFYRLPNLVRDFHRLYPEVDLKIKMGYCYEFPNWIRNNRVDIAFVLDQALYQQNIFSKILFDEPLTIVASKHHPLAAKAFIKAQDLHHTDLILTQKGSAYRALFEKYLTSAAIKPKSIIELESIEAMKHFVLNDFGISFLPRCTVMKEINNHEMQELIIEGTQFSIPAQVLYHQNKWISSALQALLVMIEKTNYI